MSQVSFLNFHQKKHQNECNLLLMSKLKKCNYCGDSRSIEEFYKRRSGHTNTCKSCIVVKSKKDFQAKNEEEMRNIVNNFDESKFKISGIRIKKNEKEALKTLGYRWCGTCTSAKKEKFFYRSQVGCIECRESAKKKWLDQNPDYFKDYRSKNKERQKEAHREWFLKNKEKKNLQNREWYYNNRERHIKNTEEARKRRLLTNPSERIAKNIRERTRNKIMKGYKSDSTAKLLGCSYDECRKHLEDQFTEGMSWDNYGFDGWHIDHIIPCASFDLTKEEEQRKCFHYTNLQPLWAEDNLKKSSKIKWK